jgi:ribosome-binding factor A
MDTTRQNKINRLMLKELSKLFLEQTKSAHGLLVTVSQVKVSSDLSVARIYVSIFPGERSQEILKNIQENTRTIRYDLAARLRYQLRRMPELTFFLDDSLDYAESINTILDKLNLE